MQMFLAGEWIDRPQKIEVRQPYDGQVIDTVPVATAEDVTAAVTSAVAGAQVMRRLSARERGELLQRTAELVAAEQKPLGRLISREEGKTLAEGEFEVGRAVETLRLSADEARRLTGETLPLDAAPGAAGKLGFTLRVPCGVVAAVTPFNFPLNLVCHKVGPALAAGNAVILKPASDTPLTALRLVELLLTAGFPPLAIQCLTGSGGTIGDALCRDERVRKITFTGSAEVGRRICQAAGLKRVTMELGSNSPLIVLPDADLDQVSGAIVASGFGNAGQVCISTQRVIAQQAVYRDLLDALAPRVSSLRTGDPLLPETQMGPLIRAGDSERVHSWIGEAVAQGARLVCGGERSGALHQPTVVADVRPEMKLCREELFGPAVAVCPAANIDEAIRLANDSRYGLSAGIFTRDIDAAFRFAREVDSGNLHINGAPAWRADLMPYGGLKESGFGKEGPKYAVQEMTELKTVVLHL